MMKKDALTFAVRASFHWLNYLNCASANTNLAIGKLGRNFKRVLAFSFAESAGNFFEIAKNYFFSFCCHVSSLRPVKLKVKND